MKRKSFSPNITLSKSANAEVSKPKSFIKKCLDDAAASASIYWLLRRDYSGTEEIVKSAPNR